MSEFVTIGIVLAAAAIGLTVQILFVGEQHGRSRRPSIRYLAVGTAGLTILILLISLERGLRWIGL